MQDVNQQTQYVNRADKSGIKPKYSTAARDQLRPPILFAGMWIYNTDTRRPNRFDGARWVELPE
jgi:hypothetical protein